MPTLHVPDASLHYDVAGEGQPVLLIQGAGVTGSGWGPQVAELAGEFQCLSFDNRGIGMSANGSRTLTIEQMAGDARALLDGAGWESAHVVGHSMGGLIAQQLALDAPERVRSLALFCTFAKGSQAARISPRVLWMAIPTRIGTRAMRRRAFLRMLFPRDFLAECDSRLLALKVGAVIGRDLADSPAIMMKQLAAMRTHDCVQQLHRLSNIPTLVVSAREDPIALPVYGRELSERIPGSRYVEIPGASHGMTIQMPGRVNHLLQHHFADMMYDLSKDHHD